MSTNKRSFRRISLRTVMTATDIVTPKGNHIRKSYQLQMEDLSAGGMRFITKFPIPVGTGLDLVFQLADRRIRAVAEVVRSERGEEGRYDVGCKFVDINRLDQEGIIKYVTLSSVRDAQPSSFYSKGSGAPSANVPISCSNCRCSDCEEKEACRSCTRANCGKRYCRMYVPTRQDLRRRS